jgi:prepilin-type N-terminal cleavage/methylation domain-containing protein
MPLREPQLPGRTGSRSNSTGRPGFTLIEASACVIIVGVLMIAAVQTLGGAIRARLLQQDQSRGLALAKQLMDEIVQCRYVDPNTSAVFGPESGESARSQFNDVDDYDKWQEKPPKTRAGADMTAFANWNRKVDVSWVDPNDPATTVSSDQGLKRIIVSVTSPRGRVTTLTALRSNYSPYDNQPSGQVTFVSWAGVTIQIGNNPAATAVASTPIVNQVP